MDSPQAAARDGRHRGDRVPDGQAQVHEDERTVLRIDERRPLRASCGSDRQIANSLIARARIVAVNIAGDVRRIRFALEDPFGFHAGQYLFIVHPTGRRIPFSIASGPQRLPELELHFRPIAGNDEATLVNELLSPNARLTLDGPYGDVHVATSTSRPLWLFAGGTGVSQALSIASFLTTRSQRAAVRLVWSVAHKRDLYCESDVRALEKRHWFRAATVIDAPGDTTNAAVRFIARHRGDMTADARIVISGGPGFVSSVAEALVSHGIARERLESDLFSYRS